MINQNRTFGFVKYYPNSYAYPDLAGGTPYSVSKGFDAGKSNATKIVASHTIKRQVGGTKSLRYNLAAKAGFEIGFLHLFEYLSPTTFHWVVEYGPNLEHHYESYGQYISTPPIFYDSTLTNYITWQLTVSNACGSAYMTNSESFFNRKRLITSRTDLSNVVAVADITDSAAYELAIEKRRTSVYFPFGSDSITINSGIEEIALEELAPYIVWDSTQMQQSQQRGLAPGNEGESEVAEMASKLFPNPAKGKIQLLVGSKFSDQEPISFTLHDQLGRLAFSENIDFRSGAVLNIDVSQVAEGIYIATMKQQGTEERTRLVIQRK